MNKASVPITVRKEVESTLSGESTGHDWWHIVRVCNTALALAKKEGADLLIVELAALLHDIADWKFQGGDSSVGTKRTKEILTDAGVSQPEIDKVIHIIENLSFKGAGKNVPDSLKGKFVQDADRLDALGAIGIARAFSYGGYKGDEMHNPLLSPRTFEGEKEYAVKHFEKNTTVNHFYEKIFKLSELMNTKTGKKRAKERHKFIEDYLQQFYAEWNGEL